MPIDIPSGIDTGTRMQLRGAGEVGPAGGPSGDLFVEFRVLHDDHFSRDGDDLLATMQLSMLDAISGTETSFEGLDGKVTVIVPQGTQSGESVTIRERGIEGLRSGKRGDLRIAFQVITPTKLSNRERKILDEFAKVHQAAEPRLAEFQQGFFGRMRDRFFKNS